MSYLLRNQQEILLVDYNPRSGLYYQNFKNGQSSKINSIMANAVNHYSAALNERSQLHIVCKNVKNQIVSLIQTSTGFDKEILLDDFNNTYEICNLHTLFIHNQQHLFYCASNPTTQSKELIHHIISKEPLPPQSVATIPVLTTSYDCFIHNNILYLLVIVKEDQEYVLAIRSYDFYLKEWSPLEVVTSSNLPITHCKLCIDEKNIYHITFIEDRYGQYQLLYSRKKEEGFSSPRVLHATAHPISPTFFIYHNTLWMNWIESGHLKMKCSVNQGEDFSAALPCSSSSTKMKPYHFVQSPNLKEKKLICNEMYAFDSPMPRLAVVSMLDMDNIHPDLIPNKELSLYLNCFKQFFSPTIPKEHNEKLQALLQENLQLKEIQNNIMQQYEQTANLARQIQEEGKKWRDRCLEAEQASKKYQQKLNKLNKSVQDKTEDEHTVNSEENGLFFDI